MEMNGLLSLVWGPLASGLARWVLLGWMVGVRALGWTYFPKGQVVWFGVVTKERNIAHGGAKDGIYRRS